MQTANPESKARLLILLGVPVLLFGGFAVWGVVERAVQNAPDAVESPAKLSAERKAAIAKQKEAFALRKQMATFGKKGDYAHAAAIVTDAFLARNDYRNLRFLRAEAWLRTGNKRGGNALRDALKGDTSLNEHEADLLAGRTNAFRDATTDVLRKADPAKPSPLDANNLAWRAVLIPGAADAAGVRIAAGLAERAVSDARKSGDKDTLATYTNTLGAVYVRAGRPQDAVRLLNESETLRPDPFDAAFLSLAYRDLGNETAAKQWRDRLKTYLDTTYATRDGQDNRHQLLLFWREGQESSGKRNK